MELKKWVSCCVNYFMGNSTILRVLFYLTIKVFGVNNTLFRGKVYLLVKLSEAVYYVHVRTFTRNANTA